MKIKLYLTLAGGLVLAACASEPPAVDLNTSLHHLIGHKVSDAEAILGHARLIHPIHGGVVYSWIYHQKTPRGGPTARQLQNQTGAELAAAMQQNPGSVQPPATCNLSMTANRSHRILSFHLTGDASQCGPLKARFAGQE